MTCTCVHVDFCNSNTFIKIRLTVPGDPVPPNSMGPRVNDTLSGPVYQALCLTVHLHVRFIALILMLGISTRVLMTGPRWQRLRKVVNSTYLLNRPYDNPDHWLALIVLVRFNTIVLLSNIKCYHLYRKTQLIFPTSLARF